MTDSNPPDGSDPGDTVDIRRIMEILPHRYPMLLIDRLEALVPGERGRGIKNVTINEPFFQGHFPSAPVMPGVLIIEAMAQTAAVVVMSGDDADTKGKLVYFMAIDGAKFRKVVGPGDTLCLELEVLQKRRNVAKFSGRALVAGTLVAEARLTAMIADA